MVEKKKKGKMKMLLVGFLIAIATFTECHASIPPEWQKKVDSLNGFFSATDAGEINKEGYPGIYMVSSQNLH